MQGRKFLSAASVCGDGVDGAKTPRRMIGLRDEHHALQPETARRIFPREGQDWIPMDAACAATSPSGLAGAIACEVRARVFHDIGRTPVIARHAVERGPIWPAARTGMVWGSVFALRRPFAATSQAAASVSRASAASRHPHRAAVGNRTTEA